MRTLATLISVSFLASAMAQDTYTLKLKLYPGIGQSVMNRDTSKDRGTTKILNAEGKVILDIKPGGAEHIAEITTFAAEADGDPTRFLRRYEKSNITENDKTETHSYEGKTLFFDKLKERKYRIGVVGENTLNGKDITKLFESVSRPSEAEALYRLLVPTKAVKVGESWTVDMKKFAELAEGSIEVKKSKGTAKLLKVVNKGKSPIGTIEVDLSMFVTEMFGKKEFKFKDPAELSMKGTIEIAIDGSSTERNEKFVMKMKGTTEVDQGGQKLKIVFDVEGDINASSSAETPAKVKSPPQVTWLSPPGEWVKYEPKSKSFQVEWPGVAVEELSKDPKNPTDVWYVELDKRSLSYSIGRTKLNVPDPDKVDGKAILDGVVKGIKDPKVKEFKFLNSPAVELEYTKNGVEYYHRMIVIKDVMWQQFVMAMPGKSKAEDREKFFKSFEIKADPKK